MDILNDRQTQILRLVSEGLSDQSIATRLGMSIHTIKWHNRQIYHRIDVASRTQAVAWARQYLWDQGEEKQRHNLPDIETNFVGRESIVSQISSSTRRSRVTTLVGPPGIGKTRLAVETGRRILDDFAEGIWLVNLANCMTIEQFWHEVAELFGVRTEPNQPLADLVARRLHRGRRLLIIDNADQVSGLSEVVETRLITSASLRILVTSRHPLGVYGEQEFPIPPLDSISSVQLFLERARAVDPDFGSTGTKGGAIEELCQRLEGLPLSIELAAARVRILSPEALLDRFQKQLDFLSVPGRTGRRSSLRDAIDTSYRLLKAEETLMFQRLSVFNGFASIEAIEAVCGAGLDSLVVLESLLTNSLLRRESSILARFGMYESLREYAMEHLDTNEFPLLNRAHAEYFCSLVQHWGAQIRSEHGHKAVQILEMERQNWLQALEWASLREPTLLWSFTSALGDFWLATSRFEESRNWLLKTLETVEGHPESMKARTLMQAAGLFIYTHSETDKVLGRSMADRAVEITRRGELSQLIPWALAVRAAYDGMRPTRMAGNLDLAFQAVKLAEENNDRACQSLATMIGGRLHYLNGEYDLAAQAFESALNIARQTGERRVQATALGNLGIVARRRGHLPEAETHLKDAIGIIRKESYDLHLSATLLIFSVGILADRKETELALRILSSAEAVLGTIKGSLLMSSDDFLENDRTFIMTAFQKKQADRVWLEGQSLPLDDALRNLLEYWERTKMSS